MLSGYGTVFSQQGEQAGDRKADKPLPRRIRKWTLPPPEDISRLTMQRRVNKEINQQGVHPAVLHVLWRFFSQGSHGTQGPLFLGRSDNESQADGRSSQAYPSLCVRVYVCMTGRRLGAGLLQNVSAPPLFRHTRTVGFLKPVRCKEVICPEVFCPCGVPNKRTRVLVFTFTNLSVRYSAENLRFRILCGNGETECISTSCRVRQLDPTEVSRYFPAGPHLKCRFP